MGVSTQVTRGHVSLSPELGAFSVLGREGLGPTVMRTKGDNMSIVLLIIIIEKKHAQIVYYKNYCDCCYDADLQPTMVTMMTDSRHLPTQSIKISTEDHQESHGKYDALQIEND